MGYYFTMMGDLKIKKEKIKEFKEKLKEIKKKADKEEFYFVNYFFGDDFSIDEGGWLNWEEYYGKWYGDEEFVKFIKDFVEETRIYFVGEDGQQWGYYFDGKGRVFMIGFKEEIVKELK